MPAGGPDWQLPLQDALMVFANRTARDLCQQLKDPDKNGGRTAEEVVEHVVEAPLVLWGWNPGEGRIPVPMSHEEFVRHMTEWADHGASCPH